MSEFQQFADTVWAHYATNARVMPWRDTPTFYNVLVSEIMLQQTQVERVRTKFDEFMRRFPDITTLAQAKQSEVLMLWQGLGYNRRAKFLHEAAKIVVVDGEPRTFNQLVKLPGVGKNTAGAIMNYTYNSPTPFIETNIRTVYFHHFFPQHISVSDAELLEMVEKTIDSENPREWFWALMDYGAWLKKQGLGRLTTSTHYRKQSPLKGSLRQMRGDLLRELTHGPIRYSELKRTHGGDKRFQPAFDALVKEKLIDLSETMVRLTD